MGGHFYKKALKYINRKNIKRFILALLAFVFFIIAQQTKRFLYKSRCRQLTQPDEQYKIIADFISCSYSCWIR